jgi:hypothetical protein
MSEYQYKHDRAPVRSGDTLKGFAVTILGSDNLPLLLESVCCQIRLYGSKLIHTYATTYAEDTGRLTIPDVIASWPVGSYGYDIEYTLKSGLVRKYIGGTITILGSNSRC